MSEYNKIFLDTAPLIYFLDSDVNYAEKTEQIFEKILERRWSMITSTITCTEYLTYPYKTGNTEKANVFFEFLSDCEIKVCPVDIAIAKKAARIRALYKDFKTMDCLQLAAACLEQYDLFLTNDKQLRQFDEIESITIDDF